MQQFILMTGSTGGAVCKLAAGGGAGGVDIQFYVYIYRTDGTSLPPGTSVVSTPRDDYK